MATRMTKYNPRNITYNESARQQFNISPPLRGGGGSHLGAEAQKNPWILTHFDTLLSPIRTSHSTPSRPRQPASVTVEYLVFSKFRKSPTWGFSKNGIFSGIFEISEIPNVKRARWFSKCEESSNVPNSENPQCETWYMIFADVGISEIPVDFENSDHDFRLRMASLLTYLRSYLHTYWPTYLPTHLLTYLLTYLHTYLLTYLLTYLHTYVLQFRASSS